MTIKTEPAFDTRAFRRALGHFPTGVCVVTSVVDGALLYLSGMVMGVDVFEAYDGARAGTLADYYRYARDNDLYLTYVIINPQADRSKGPSEQQDRFLTAGVVDQDNEGVTIGDETKGLTLQTYGPHTYACRPPGVLHGPFRPTTGCLLFEAHYYAGTTL